MAPTFEGCVTTGVYDRCENTINSDNRSFEQLKPEKLYSGRGNTWGGNKSTTRFYHHVSRTRANEAAILLIGEVLGPGKGTAMGGLGAIKLLPNAVLLFLLPSIATNSRNTDRERPNHHQRCCCPWPPFIGDSRH